MPLACFCSPSSPRWRFYWPHWGSYGVISYMVTQRAHELGIRIALGASRANGLRLVLGQSLFLTLSGVFLGLLGSMLLNRLIASLLFIMKPTNPATFAGVALFLTVTATLASLLPAGKATRVDPTITLRYE